MKKVFIVIIVFVLILLSLGLIFKQNIAEFYTEKILMKEYVIYAGVNGAGKSTL